MYGIINCTNHCNMACTYCFEENWKECKVNINEINYHFSEAINKFVLFSVELCKDNSPNIVHILLHGGEPLLISTDLIEELFDKITSKVKNVHFIIQSNGTIITSQVIKLLKKFNVSLGISLDGDAISHDKFRVFKGGTGTHNIILSNIKKIQKEHIDVGCLITFNKYNLSRIDDVYSFFSKNNISFSFNPFFTPSNDKNYNSIKFTDELYINSIKKLFDLWINDNNSNISIPTFERIIDGLTNTEGLHHVCTFSRDCSSNFIAIDTAGLLYICNHFCNNCDLAFSEYSTSISEIMKSNSIFKTRWDKLQNTDCKNCEISNLCYGGCPYHAYVANGTYYKKDPLCVCYKAIITHISNYLKEELI